MKMYRQGDVLIKEIAGIPLGDRRKRKAGEILEGEATGHIHRLAEEDLAGAEVLEVGDGLFLSVSNEGGVSIVHDEHSTLTIPPGTYEIVRQREYSPEAIRNVAD